MEEELKPLWSPHNFKPLRDVFTQEEIDERKRQGDPIYFSERYGYSPPKDKADRIDALMNNSYQKIFQDAFKRNPLMEATKEKLEYPKEDQYKRHHAMEIKWAWVSENFVNKLKLINNQGETQMKDPIFSTPEKLIGKLIYGIKSGKKYSVYCIGRVLKVCGDFRLERNAGGFKEVKDATKIYHNQEGSNYALKPEQFNISWFLSKAEAELYAKDLNLQENDD